MVDGTAKLKTTFDSINKEESKNQITSIECLMKKLEDLVRPVIEQEDEGLFFYRGEGNKEWEVQAGIYRKVMRRLREMKKRIS